MKMEEHFNFALTQAHGVKREEDEEDFQSCCGDENELNEKEEPMKKNLDEDSIYMYFKGVSFSGVGECCAGLSGIGVVMERLADTPFIQVQKKLNFFVDESVADYLALMDGLLEAVQNKITRVFAFTDSELLYNQITNGENLDNPLALALRQRVLEHVGDFKSFILKFVPRVNLERPLRLAQIAIGIISLSNEVDKETVDNCSICCEDKSVQMMITMRCTHKFCSHCMKTYVETNVESSQVPIKCPELECKYNLTAALCKSFLPDASYEMLERVFTELNVLYSEKIYCPFPDCSVVLDPLECLSTRASSSSQSENGCVECPDCSRFICVECVVPWHTSMSCEEYQDLPLLEREAGDITLHRLAQNKKWRRCQECRRMIELAHGCYHMTCWCGHEFCYSCGVGYDNGQQACQCIFWDESNNPDFPINNPIQQCEQWAWDSFDSLPMIMDAYSEQERSQLALIQRFLNGGFSLSDHPPNDSAPQCTDSYVDPMKDIHQLPWLERFVSVISDNYYEDYMQS